VNTPDPVMGHILDHPERRTLNDEVHARPPDPVQTPSSMSYIARFSGSGQAAEEYRLLTELLECHGLQPPPPDANHCIADAGKFRLRWERHTEFTRYSIAVDGVEGEPFAHPPLLMLPDVWLQQLSESVLVGIHTCVLPMDEDTFSVSRVSNEYFSDNVLVGAQIAGGGGIALTDFRIHGDGFSRMLVLNEAMNVRQTGRMLLRLLEIETYRMMTLLALPVARSLAPQLDSMEKEVGAISVALAEDDVHDDQKLLDRIIRLAAQSEASSMRSQFRFAAAEAYNRLVRQRIAELREVRMTGVQNFEEFYSRRLTPAVHTCRAAAARQRSVADRTARATRLLSTRVDVERQRQNQSLLTSMNKRAEMQLRLQATVEGLSVAAITYYVVGLIYYMLQAAEEIGWPVRPSLLTALSVPVVAFVIFSAVRRVRKRLSSHSP
jgi:uncharacterized membrane-anchored protein